MSHIVEIRTEVRDPLAVIAACQRLQLPAPSKGNTGYTAAPTAVAVQAAGHLGHPGRSLAGAASDNAPPGAQDPLAAMRALGAFRRRST